MRDFTDILIEFDSSHEMATPGKLALILQLNRLFSQATPPIDPQDFKTKKKGQIAKVSGDKASKILAEHGITRRLASEGGRTTRGGHEILEDYADFANEVLPTGEEYTAMEAFWVSRIRDYFNRTPLKLKTDAAVTPTSAIEDLFRQARSRESGVSGATYAGTLLQNLVAAKLRTITPNVAIEGTSTADAPTGRSGDFNIGDAAIHCTTAPTAALVSKCEDNLAAGMRPIIITVSSRVRTARDMVEDAGIGTRVEVWDVTQFLSSNVWEHGMFARDGRRDTMKSIVEEYNAIVDKYENDPSMRITL